jgi:hypothetical protein
MMMMMMRCIYLYIYMDIYLYVKRKSCFPPRTYFSWCLLVACARQYGQV